MRLVLALLCLSLPVVFMAGCVEQVEESSGPPPGGAVINNPTPMGGGAGAGSGKVELNLFTWTEVDELAVNQELARDFEKENPGVTVKINNISGSREAMQKLETMFSSKAGPDVMSLHGAYYVGFAQAGVLADLESFIAKDPDFALNDIHPRLVDLCRYEGKLYSLPRYTSVYSLFYNKALFDAAGLAYPGKGATWTWADYLKAARALTKDTNGDGKTDQWGCIIDFWGARLYPWLWANDADLMDKDRKTCQIGSPSAVEALQFLADLRLKYKVAPATTSTERNEALDRFARGSVGMYMSGPWDIQTLKRVNTLQWDVAPVPQKKRQATMLGTENYAVYSGSRHPQEAYKLFKFLLSARAQSIMADKLDKMPSRLSVLQGSYASGQSTYDRKVYVDALEYAQQPPNFPEYSQIEGLLQAELDRIWIGQQTVPAGLKAAASKVNAKLTEIRARQ
jgi:multiple sugar transport system substrate-binding protein